MTKTAFKWVKDARTGAYKCRIAGRDVYLGICIGLSDKYSKVFQLSSGVLGCTGEMFSVKGVREAKEHAENLIRARAAEQYKLWSEIVEALET